MQLQSRKKSLEYVWLIPKELVCAEWYLQTYDNRQGSQSMSSTSSPIKNLREALADGLGIVSRIWEFKARNWVTCMYVADIDGDGDAEIIIGSREGRIYCLSKTGKMRWRRDIGSR